jgi:hypothetical protein
VKYLIAGMSAGFSSEKMGVINLNQCPKKENGLPSQLRGGQENDWSDHWAGPLGERGNEGRRVVEVAGRFRMLARRG